VLATRRCQGGNSTAEPGELDLEGTLPVDGGLAVWRAGQEGPELKLPVILFPSSDLLLVGQTKRMHLFEERWVNMVDTARRNYGGVIGLVYFSPDSNVVDVITTAEVIACGNLGPAGRMVTVRGSARARLRGLSPAVANPDQWGVALVEELPEVLPEDLEHTGEGEPIAAELLAAEVASLIQELDLKLPESSEGAAPEGAAAAEGAAADGMAAARGAGVEAAAEEEDSGDEDFEATANRDAGPKLWTHERSTPEESFSVLAGAGSWYERREEVRKTLSGVPLVPQPREFEDLDAAWGLDMDSQSGGPGGKAAVVTFYAALGAADLQTRLELFTGRSRSLSHRMRDLLQQLRELQGMARARRAVAGVFSGEADGKASA